MSKKKSEELLRERVQRVNDALALKEPDRVPITPFVDVFFPGIQAGFSHKDTMYKGRKISKAWFKVVSRYDWDLYPSPLMPGMGKLYDLIEYKGYKWAGAADPEFRLADNQPYQYIEKTWMEAEDYDKFLSDMTGYLLRTIIPKQNGFFKSFEKLPNPSNLAMGAIGLIPFLMDKEVKKTLKFKGLMGAMIGIVLGDRSYKKKMKKLGNPVHEMSTSGIGMAPFDFMSDFLRGMRGTMLDMYRNPEELKRACELIANYELETLDLEIANSSGEAKKDTVDMRFMPLHRGADGFMSNEQFEEFYWPTLTKVIEGFMDRGLTPMPFFEGRYNERLEYLAEFAKKHKGKRKLVYWFHDTDIIKAKEMMGDYITIRGNVPASLLVGGPPKAVEEYVKKCIEGCKDGGGYLVDGGVGGIPNESKHENVKAMTDAVHKYGVYRK
jgi:uroporphyrinogen-III decarboxylase